MSGKIFLTPEVWEKSSYTNYKITHTPNKSQIVNPLELKKADKSHKWKEGVQKNAQFSFCRQKVSSDLLLCILRSLQSIIRFDIIFGVFLCDVQKTFRLYFIVSLIS